MRLRASVFMCGVVLSSSACGYRIVRTSDIRAQQFARDSAAISTLRHELVTLQTQCHADSLRLEGQLAAQRAAAASTPQADSLLKLRNTEIAGLREQLTKVSAELDRIKRRLANPRG